MKKLIDIICVILWGSLVLYGIAAIAISQPVNPISFTCAAVLCCLRYVERLLNDKE